MRGGGPGPEGAGESLGVNAPAFLLAQIGGLAAARFAERLATLGLSPPHAGILRLIALAPGTNQRALADRLGILPARLVGLIDHLEQRGLLERHRDPEDRRSHALRLTQEGHAMLGRIGRLSQEHQRDLLAGLDDAERSQLGHLLRKVAAHHGMTPGVHPGYRDL